jgi:hypothetical protein
VIITVAAVAALLLPILLGGSPVRMATVRLRFSGWVVGALLVQVLVLELLDGPRLLLEAAHVATYVVAAAFLLVNARVPGLWLVGLGTVSNGVTIALNDGTLPARLGALEAAGMDVTRTDFVNSGVVENAKLPWLGDVFAIPAPLPLANVFSIGDVLIITGIAVAAWRICGTRWTRPWGPPRHRLEGRRREHAPGRHQAVRAIPAQRRSTEQVAERVSPAVPTSRDRSPART